MVAGDNGPIYVGRDHCPVQLPIYASTFQLKVPLHPLPSSLVKSKLTESAADVEVYRVVIRLTTDSFRTFVCHWLCQCIEAFKFESRTLFQCQDG
jgi:hypothetical protein